MRWLDGHGFGWTQGVGDGQGGLACCGSWGCKELDMTEQLSTAQGQGKEAIGLGVESGFEAELESNLRRQ